MTTVAVLVLMAATTTALLAPQQPAEAGLEDRWHAFGDALLEAPDAATIERLARLEESTGHWSRALAAWTAWRPRSTCGNCGASSSHRRTFGIARCRFALGEREEAIALVRDIVTERDCPNGFHSEAFMLYLDMCLRDDRLAEAREVVDDLDDDGGLLAALGLGGDAGMRSSARAFSLDPGIGLAIAEAAAAGKPGVIIDVMRTVDPRARNTADEVWPPVDPEWKFAGRTLRRLGAPGRDALLPGVVARDPVAIALAGLAGFQQLRPALEAARSGDAETDALIDDALERLRRGALKRERPERLVGD